MTSTEKKSSGVLFILLASLFWSFGGVLSKFAPWSAFTLAGFRSVVSVLILGLYRRSFRVRANAPTWIGAVGVAMTSTLFLLSTKLTSAANAIVLQYAMPVFVILYQALVLKRKPSRVDVGSAAVVLLAVILTVFLGQLTSTSDIYREQLANIGENTVIRGYASNSKGLDMKDLVIPAKNLQDL